MNRAILHATAVPEEVQEDEVPVAVAVAVAQDKQFYWREQRSPLDLILRNNKKELIAIMFIFTMFRRKKTKNLKMKSGVLKHSANY